MKHATLFVALLTTTLLASCAHVTFHTDPELKKKTGLKFYSAKPYLLVSYTGAKDNPIKIETINLPDLDNPTYAVYHRGWGSHEFNVGVNTNGTLSTYGQKADSKGPETLTALGSLLSSAGAGFNSAATGISTLNKQSAAHDAATKAVREANAIVSAIATKTPAEISPYLSLQAEAAKASQILGKVAAGIPSDPQGQIGPLEGAKAGLTAAQIVDPAPTDKAMALKTDVARAIALITTAVTALKTPASEPAPKPDFKLFEFVQEDGVKFLREVRISSGQLNALKAVYAK
jgi:hypothetical protein